MASKRATDPNGHEWTVRRKWVHRQLRWRGTRGSRALDLMDGADFADLGGDLPVVGLILTAIAVLLVAIVAVILIIPALIFVAELLIVVGLVGLGLMGRVLLGRPWTVEAHMEGTDHTYEWKARGWRASTELVQTLANHLRETGLPAGGERVPLDRK